MSAPVELSPRLRDVLSELPEEWNEAAIVERAGAAAISAWIAGLGQRPVPVGRWPRFWAMSSLSARVAFGYAAWWLRSAFAGSDARTRSLNETHLKAALDLLATMGYLRGVVMKVGQLLANAPDLAPTQFTDMLGTLHFQAPPMHFALLREHVRNELGADPEAIFDDFEPEAFAAASLGQVHRARLKGSSRPVAVKIQYPGIARTIRDDMSNLLTLLLPMRLSGDWENLKAQLADVAETLEGEADYVQEADHLERAAAVFGSGDEIVIPRVHRSLTTPRMLTMDFLEGRHLGDYLRTSPSQEDRDRRAHQVMLAAFRTFYTARLCYADPHPGNFLFLPDGRLGLIDFGCCRVFSDEEWAMMRVVEEAMIDGSRERLWDALAYAIDLPRAPGADDGRMRLLEAYNRWLWEPLVYEGPFDFGDADYLRRGMDIYIEIIKRRYTRSRPINTWIMRGLIGQRVMVHRLGGRVDVKALYAREKRP